MDSQERQAEIIRIRTEYAEILSTPLMSTGEISPAQVGMMSKNRRETWQANGQARLMLEARIRELNRTDDEIAAEESENARRDGVSRISALTQRIELLQRVGIGKSGKIRPTYQREIDKMREELAVLQATA